MHPQAQADPLLSQAGDVLGRVREARFIPHQVGVHALSQPVGVEVHHVQGYLQLAGAVDDRPHLVPAGVTPLGLPVPERPARWHRRSAGQLRIARDDVRDPRAVNQEEVQAIVLSLDLGRDRRRGTAAEVPGDPEGGVQKHAVALGRDEKRDVLVGPLVGCAPGVEVP